MKLFPLVFALLGVQIAAAEPSIMLAGPWVPKSTHEIDFAALPKVPSEHVIISDVSAKGSDPTKLDKKSRRREPTQLPRAS